MEGHSGHFLLHTFGFHVLLLGLKKLSALIYSACMRLAAGIKSPSALLMATISATSTIPFLMPASKITTTKFISMLFNIGIFF